MAGSYGMNGWPQNPAPPQVSAPNYFQQNPMSIHVIDHPDEINQIQVGPGRTAYIFSRNEDVFYVKAMDASGVLFPIRTFDFKERETSVAGNFATKQDIADLRQLIEDLTK